MGMYKETKPKVDSGGGFLYIKVAYLSILGAEQPNKPSCFG
jgi:hypothetical protein